jgi:hypothetical protein
MYKKMFRNFSDIDAKAIRMQRSLQERIYLLKINEEKSEFIVRGSSSKVYHIFLSSAPSCNCPDFLRRKAHCKHLYFVLQRVLKLPSNDLMLSKMVWTEKQCKTIAEKIQNVQSFREVFASSELQEAYANALKQQSLNQEQKETNKEAITQRTLESDCPICYEPLLLDKADEKSNQKHENLVYCRAQCLQSVHESCFKEWEQSEKSYNRTVTCPYCREAWKGENKEKEDEIKYIEVGTQEIN